MSRFLLLRILNRTLREGSRIKDFLRYRVILKFRPNVPRELMVNGGDCVVQIGTPSTKTMARLSKSVGPEGRVFLVEPAEGNIRRLQTFRDRYGLRNVVIIPKAAWNKAGQHRFLLASRDDDHRLENVQISHDNDLREQQEHGGYQECCIVDVDTVESMMQAAGVTSIDYIEIAVNGAELNVLEGMGDLLKSTRRLFVKGHARNCQTGDPISVSLSQCLANDGFCTTITRSSSSVAESWGAREGDVYAWVPALQVDRVRKQSQLTL